MTDRTDLWILTGSGVAATADAVAHVTSLEDHLAVIAPWSGAVTTELPPGGVADTDWGMATTSRLSVRWRREASESAFVLISLDDATDFGARHQAVDQVSVSSYLMYTRYRRATGLARIEETRYLTAGGQAITRYRLSEEVES